MGTIEGAVAFYDGETFNNSPARKILDSLTGGEGIELDVTQIEAIAAFLRVIAALENIRQGTEFLNSFLTRSFSGNEIFDQLPTRAGQETNNAIKVLEGSGLNLAAVAHLRKAAAAIDKVIKMQSGRKQNLKEALTELGLAHHEIIEQ